MQLCCSRQTLFCCPSFCGVHTSNKTQTPICRTHKVLMQRSCAQSVKSIKVGICGSISWVMTAQVQRLNYQQRTCRGNHIQERSATSGVRAVCDGGWIRSDAWRRGTERQSRERQMSVWELTIHTTPHTHTHILRVFTHILRPACYRHTFLYWAVAHLKNLTREKTSDSVF